MKSNSISERDDSELEALLAGLASPAKAVARRSAEVLAARAVDDPQIGFILRGRLLHGDPRVRWAAAYTLGMIDGALGVDVIPALIEAIGNRDGDIRWAAAELIIRVGGEQPAPMRDALVAIRDDAGIDARKMALYCLRDLGASGPEVMARATQAARASHPALRLAALAILSRCVGANASVATEITLEMLESDPDAGVRRGAAIALGRIGKKSARVAAALRRAAKSDDASLARAAERSLALLGE
ncbi:MAG TPA: HEAT repeat domain-containing protein [Candidatus Binataceae bacterium]|nr:HEAT repeat domain-containing protein [Candidatus Binataceae bacterium]